MTYEFRINLETYEKLGFRKLCTFPGFFKINGELIDFDLMNLELVPTAKNSETL